MIHYHLLLPEPVSEGHPDKIADQISDAALMQFRTRSEARGCLGETYRQNSGMVDGVRNHLPKLGLISVRDR